MSLAVVTGGSRGIGLAISKQLALSKHIQHVVIIGRNQENIDSAIHSFDKRISCSVQGLQCDVSDPKMVNECVSKIKLDTHANIKYLVNAAGITNDSLLLRTSDAAISNVIGTNLLGSIYFSKAVLKDMLRNKGAILNIGSIVGSSGNPGQSIYSASKSGLIGFTKSLAREVGPKNVRVNIIEPGYIDTDMTKSLDKQSLESKIPLRRFGSPESVAGLAEYLLLDPSADYITGQLFRIDGGLI